MSNVTERKANEIFDEFVGAFLNGDSPDAETFLARCHVSERPRVAEAIAGFLFAYEHYFSCLVSEELVESAVARLKRVRQRKQRLAEAKLRAAAESWEQTVTQPLLHLAGILYPESAGGPAQSHADGIVIMNRANPGNGLKTGQALDEFTKRAAERLAQREAERLLARAEVTMVPVPLETIAEQLGVLVQEAPMQGLEGCLVTDGESGGILLNSLMPDARRKRYTFAHELGHFILHRRSSHRLQSRGDAARFNKESEIFNFSDQEGEVFNPKSRQELEASAFASYLLMPPTLLPAEFGREVPCFEMAETVSGRFNVSLMAVLRRLVRESHHRTIFICCEDERLRTFDFSSEIDGFNRIVSPVPKGSAAWALWNGEAIDTYVREVPADVWFEAGGLVNERCTLIEESRRFPTGHIYTLLNVLEES